MDCKYCGHELPIGTHGKRVYCNDAHKQAYWRQQHQADQDAALLSELEALRAQVRDQAQENAEQDRVIADLRARLDIEKRYLSDTTPRYFRAFLKKQPTSPWRTAFLNDQLVPARGPRSIYEAHVRRLHFSEEERDDFVRLWKIMLLQS